MARQGMTVEWICAGCANRWMGRPATRRRRACPTCGSWSTDEACVRPKDMHERSLTLSLTLCGLDKDQAATVFENVFRKLYSTANEEMEEWSKRPMFNPRGHPPTWDLSSKETRRD